MSSEVIPPDIAAFIQCNFDSIAELEALLLMRKTPAQDWTVAELASRLYITVVATHEAMDRLRTRGLVVSTVGGAYYSQDRTAEGTVAQVAKYYAKYLIPVSNLIHAKQSIRVQKFADAFKLKKDT